MNAGSRISPHYALGAIGLTLVGGCLALRALSPHLGDFASAGIRGTLGLVALLVVMGAVFLLLLRWIPRASATPALVLGCLALGLVMRLTQFGATPAYEDDYLRYLWDGAVTSAGLDPYAAPPVAAEPQRLLRSIRRESADKAEARDWALADLADAAPGLLERTSYPYLTTIYPPVSQLAFATAHQIAPFSLDAWRVVLLCTELLGLAVLIRLLQDDGQHPLWCLLYWWNPVAVMQIAHAAHMDALLIPALLLALLAIAHQRPVLTAVALAIATGIKLWPLVLMPSLLSASPDRRRNLVALLLGLALSLAVLWPELRHLGSQNQGLQAFASEWARNAFAFRWLSVVFHQVGGTGDGMARLCVLLIISGLCLAAGLMGPAGARTWARRWGLAIAALFLLAPVGYPWYFVWFLPLLCLWRSVPLLMLSALLPLYYGLFAVDALGPNAVQLDALLAVEFLPTWIGLAWVAWPRTVRTMAHARA